MSINPSTRNLELAQKLVTEINATIQSSHQICDRIREMPPTAAWELEGRVSKNLSWDKLIRFLDYDVQRERIQEAVCQASRNDLIGDLRVDLAVAKFGKGECGEMATVAQMKAARVAHTMLVSTGSTPDSDPIAYNHRFVVLLPSLDDGKKIVDEGCATKKSGKPIAFNRFLKVLPKDAVILDPFLKIACLASDILTKGADLLDYSKVWNLKYVWDIRVLGCNSPKIAQIEKGVEEAYQKAKEIFPSIVASGGCASKLNEIAVEARGILAEVFPGTEWKSNKERGLRIFHTGSKDNAEKISHLLKQHEIQHANSQVRNQTDRCIVIQNPDLFKLRSLLKTYTQEEKS